MAILENGHEKARLTLAEVESFLTSHCGDIHNVAPLQGGEWSQAFAFLDGADWVIRFGEFEADFSKDRLAHQYACPDLPIPHVIEIGKGLGLTFCISERMKGQMLDDLGPDEWRASVPAILSMFDALREADVSNTSGYGGWDAQELGEQASWRSFLLQVDEESERVHGWHDNMAKSAHGLEPFKKGFDYLISNLDCCPEDRHLLHTDLLHFNVLVEENRVSGVFDWGNSMYGDHLYELALFTFYAPWYPAMKGIDWAGELERHNLELKLDVPSFRERLSCYEVHIGLSGMAYTAFKQNWVDFEFNVARTSEVLSRRLS